MSVVAGESYRQGPRNRKATVVELLADNQVLVELHGGERVTVKDWTLNPTWAEYKQNMAAQREREAQRKSHLALARREAQELVEMLGDRGLDAQQVYNLHNGRVGISLSLEASQRLRDLLAGRDASGNALAEALGF